VPIAAIVGSRDEYLDRRPAALLEALARNAIRARSFTGIVIPGALHGFQKHEDVVARAIVRWVQRRCLLD
jgi:dienelactone hydrolase